MMRRLALLVLLLLLLLVLPPAPARAGHTSGIRVDTVVHGIKLSLILDKQTYPANALVRATVRVKNLSGAAIDLGASSGRFCPTTSPGIRVLDGAGAIVYPPEVDDYSICTPLPYDGVLPPGGSIQRHLLVMLRSSYLQAVVSVGRYTGIESAILPLHLRPASPLSAVLSLEPSPHADVEQPSAGYGPLYSFQVAECRTASSDTVIGSLHWEAIPRQGKSVYRLRPKCEPLSTWHVVAGFLNHPVAVIDYVKPQAQPQSFRTNQRVAVASKSSVTTPQDRQLVPPCRASSLRASADWQGENTTKIGAVIFSLRGRSVCRLRGRPRIQVQVNGHLQRVRQQALTAYPATLDTTERTVVLRPGHQAGVEFDWSNWCGGQVHMPIVLIITLPHHAGQLSTYVRYGYLRRSANPPACPAPTQPSIIEVGYIRPVNQRYPIL